MNDEQPKLVVDNAYRGLEYYIDYANNVYVEGSAWDLKMVFGQLDQSTVPARVEQRGAVTLPWAQAKILAYFMCLHLAGYEMQNGTINVPQAVMPPIPTPPTEEAKKTDPNLQSFFERMVWIREQFFGPATVFEATEKGDGTS
jgi:hypothetical protein